MEILIDLPFKKMLRMAQLNEIDIVVCYKVDRIARNTLDFLKILELFKENNVELISISEGFLTRILKWEKLC